MINKDTSVKQGASVQKYKDKGMERSRKIRQFVCRIRVLEWRDRPRCAKTEDTSISISDDKREKVTCMLI